MRVMIDSETTIVAGTSIFQVRVGTGSSDRSMKVTVTLDGRLEWTFDQPAWRPLSYGCRHGMPYLWRRGPLSRYRCSRTVIRK